MFYDRKVKYLDYCESGLRVKGCGVVKLQMRDRSVNIEVLVNGLPMEDGCRTGVLLCTMDGKEYEIGVIEIAGGKGDFRFQCGDVTQLHNVGGYDEWMGLRIDLGVYREIRGMWREETAVGRAQRELARMDTGVAEVTGRALGQIEATIAGEASQNVVWMDKSEVKTILEEAVDGKAYEDGMTQQNVEQGRGYAAEPAPKKNVHERVHTPADGKWEQLWNIYPHIRPFQDEREYISLTPADFVIFTAESYKAVNNSFLLHGFYNYHHLLLTRMERKGEMVCYVGVPGNYFEREKQVAIMFGFESFECQEEPAQAGDFGYYMMRAQL